MNVGLSETLSAALPSLRRTPRRTPRRSVLTVALLLVVTRTDSRRTTALRRAVTAFQGRSVRRLALAAGRRAVTVLRLVVAGAVLIIRAGGTLRTLSGRT